MTAAVIIFSCTSILIMMAESSRKRRSALMSVIISFLSGLGNLILSGTLACVTFTMEKENLLWKSNFSDLENCAFQRD